MGGAVRDALMGSGIADLDAVTTAPPDTVRRLCDGAPWCRRVYDVGERYGTIGIVLADGTTVEVSRLRGAEPDGAGTAELTFEELFAIDAGHRDLTVNAMAVRWPDLALLDPMGGERDLSARLLRAPGDPVARLAEDPLRVLRAARFVAQLGFELHPDTAAALPLLAPGLSRIAVERVRDEMTRLLVAPHVARGLDVMRETGALACVLPEVAALDGLEQPSFHDLDALRHTFATVAAAPAVPILRWAALLHDIGKAPTRSVEPDGRIRFLGHAARGAELADAICARLRFSNADRSAVVHLVREHLRLGDLDVANERAVERAVRRLDLWVPSAHPPRRLVTAEDALELAIADLSATAHRAEAPAARRALADAIAAARERMGRAPLRLPIDGVDVMVALGIEEGPLVGVALTAVRDAIADGRLEPEDRRGALDVARRAVRASVSGADGPSGQRTRRGGQGSERP